MGAKVTAQKMHRENARNRRPGAQPAHVREVLNALRRIVRSLRVASRTAELELGLSGAQLFVLQCLAQHSPCSVNELSARTATDQSSVSVVVSRLVLQGHIRRSASRADRRKVELSLTASGLALLARAPEATQGRLIAALTALPKSELGVLSRTLSKVVDLAEVSTETPSLFFEEGPALVRGTSRGQRG